MSNERDSQQQCREGQESRGPGAPRSGGTTLLEEGATYPRNPKSALGPLGESAHSTKIGSPNKKKSLPAESERNALAAMIDRVAARSVRGLHSACPACRKFTGQAGRCPGMRAKSARRGGSEFLLPLCHENFRTGRLEWPYEIAAGGGLRRVPGQEKFWEFGLDARRASA